MRRFPRPEQPSTKPILNLVEELEAEIRIEEMNDYDNAPREDRDYAKQHGKLP